MDLRGQKGAGIAHGDKQFCLGKTGINRRNIVAVGRCFFHPSSNPIERNPEYPGIRFDHQYQQIPVGIGGIERGLLECFQKFPVREIRVIVLPFPVFVPKQNFRPRFPGQIIKLRPPAARGVLGQSGWEISGVLWKNEKLGMAVEQGDQQGGSRFRLSGNEAGAFVKDKILIGRIHAVYSRPKDTPRRSLKMRTSFLPACSYIASACRACHLKGK